MQQLGTFHAEQTRRAIFQFWQTYRDASFSISALLLEFVLVNPIIFSLWRGRYNLILTVMHLSHISIHSVSGLFLTNCAHDIVCTCYNVWNIEIWCIGFHKIASYVKANYRLILSLVTPHSKFQLPTLQQGVH